LFLLCCFSSLR